MSKQVLLLNQHDLPLNVLKMKKAFNLIYKEKAEMVKEIPNSEFYHNGQRFSYPSVIRMKYFVNITKKQSLGDCYTKLNVWKRDKGKCQYCGKKMSSNKFTVDHVKPKMLGGKTKWDNIVTACFRCNNLKDSKPLDANGKVTVKDENGKNRTISLRRKPITPDQAETIEQSIIHRFKTLEKVLNKEWMSFISPKKSPKK